MKLKIYYTTQLKAELGFDSEEIEVPDSARFTDVVEMLTEKHTSAFRRLVLDNNGGLLPSVLPCVDDEQVSPEENPVLKPGGSITFLSAISGG